MTRTPKQHRSHCEHRRQQHKGRAPTQRVGGKATKPQAAHHADDGGAHQFGQGFLPAFIRHLVTHPGHGQRDDARRCRTHEAAHHQEHGQVDRQRREGAEQPTSGHRQRDHTQLAKTLAQGAIEQLHQTVDHGEHRHHARSLAGADLKLLAQHHQHRVADAHGRHTGKTGQAQQAQVALLKMV